MRTDDLIADLAARVTPVRPLPSPARRALIWGALAIACAAAGVAVFGARPDIGVRWAQADFLWIAILVVVSALLALLTTLVLAIPGAERTPVLRWSATIAFALWGLSILLAVVNSGRALPITMDPHWRACFARVLIIGVIPAVSLFAMARRSAPLRLGWTAALAAAAAMSIGALAVQIACPLDDAGHAFLGHFVPVIVCAFLALAIRRTLARRTASS